MAHVAKFGRSAVGHMMAHYRRDGNVPELRVNIDPAKTPGNYTYNGRGGEATARTVADRVAEVEAKSGRKVRSDAVVLADLVVTLPRDVRPGDEKAFFRSCMSYASRVVGADNILGGYVHVDETRPHIHIAFTPVVQRSDGKPTFNFNKMFPRGLYKRLHKDLSREARRALGYDVEVELGEDRAKEKALSAVPQDKLDEARAQIEAEYVQPALDKRDEIEAECARAAERLESLQAESREIEKEIELVDGKRAEAEGRAGILEDDARQIERETARIEGQRAEAERRVSFFERWVQRFREAAEAVAGRIEGLRGRIEELRERAKPAPKSLWDEETMLPRIRNAKIAARTFGRPATMFLADNETMVWVDEKGSIYEEDPRSGRAATPYSDLVSARAASRAINQAHRNPDVGRGRGR